MVRIGRFASFAALLTAAAISPIVEYLGGIFPFFQNVITYVACPFMATVLMGILWKRVNYAAGVFGLVGGMIIQIFLAVLFCGKLVGGVTWLLGQHFVAAHPHFMAGVAKIPGLHFFYIGGIAEVVIMIGIAIVTLLTAPPDYQKIAPYVWRPQLLESYDEGVRRPWYQQLKYWWGLVAVIWFCLYWRFW